MTRKVNPHDYEFWMSMAKQARTRAAAALEEENDFLGEPQLHVAAKLLQTAETFERMASRVMSIPQVDSAGGGRGMTDTPPEAAALVEAVAKAIVRAFYGDEPRTNGEWTAWEKEAMAAIRAARQHAEQQGEPEPVAREEEALPFQPTEAMIEAGRAVVFSDRMGTPRLPKADVAINVWQAMFLAARSAKPGATS